MGYIVGNLIYILKVIVKIIAYLISFRCNSSVADVITLNV